LGHVLPIRKSRVMTPHRRVVMTPGPWVNVPLRNGTPGKSNVLLGVILTIIESRLTLMRLWKRGSFELRIFHVPWGLYPIGSDSADNRSTDDRTLCKICLMVYTDAAEILPPGL